MKKGYSLVEVLAVIIIVTIIGAAGIWSFGLVEARQLRNKVASDLVLIDAAKGTWRAQHLRDAFNSDDTARFAQIQPYMKVGLLPVGSLAQLEPTGVTYLINGEDVAAGAQRGTSTFDRTLNDWTP